MLKRRKDHVWLLISGLVGACSAQADFEAVLIGDPDISELIVAVEVSPDDGGVMTQVPPFLIVPLDDGLAETTPEDRLNAFIEACEQDEDNDGVQDGFPSWDDDGDFRCCWPGYGCYECAPEAGCELLCESDECLEDKCTRPLRQIVLEPTEDNDQESPDDQLYASNPTARSLECLAWRCEADLDDDGMPDGELTEFSDGGFSCCVLDYGCIECHPEQRCDLICETQDCEDDHYPAGDSDNDGLLIEVAPDDLDIGPVGPSGRPQAVEHRPRRITRHSPR